MNALFKTILSWMSTLINRLPNFMVANLIELLGVLIASVLVAVISTLYVDKKRKVQKVKARVLDMRLEQYDLIRSFVEGQKNTKAFPENADDVKMNLGASGLSLKDNDSCYSSQAIATEQKMSQVLDELENLAMKGLYILDDDVLGMLLQIKIYIMNLKMFSIILRGYYVNKQNDKDERKAPIITPEDIEQISAFYYHHLSIFLNNEYQNMIVKLQEMVIKKASKPKFERKEKNYRKIKTRRRLQKKALDKTLLMGKFPQLILALASLSSAHFQETKEEGRRTTEEFFKYAIDILEWHDRGIEHRN